MVMLNSHSGSGCSKGLDSKPPRQLRAIDRLEVLGWIQIRSLVRPFGSRIKSIKCCVKEDDLGLEWLLLDIEMRSNLP